MKCSPNTDIITAKPESICRYVWDQKKAFIQSLHCSLTTATIFGALSNHSGDNGLTIYWVHLTFPGSAFWCSLSTPRAPGWVVSGRKVQMIPNAVRPKMPTTNCMTLHDAYCAARPRIRLIITCWIILERGQFIFTTGYWCQRRTH